MEGIEKGKAELSRKLDLLDAKTKVRKAQIDLMVEQSVEEGGEDGMNEYFKEHCDQNYHRGESLSQTDDDKTTPIFESQSVGIGTTSKQSSVPSFTQTQFQSSLDQNTSSREPVVTFSAVPHVIPAAHDRVAVRSCTNVSDNGCIMTPQGSRGQTNSVTTIASRPSQIEMGQTTPSLYHRSEISGLNATAAEYVSEVVSQPNASLPVDRPSFSPKLGSNLDPQFDAWLALAQAIKEGPTLPKVELMKFSGDPLEYVEFVTNFRDNIEGQVLDESLRLTGLLAQCTGKAKDVIRSCVNLPVGSRYSEACRTLRQNFGQPHMIVEAHMKKLREIQVRRADASALMEYVRRLEDVRRVLANMGSNYMSCLDNEDVIAMLMRKLPEEGLKRKWVDRAGDLIKTKGRAEFTDFVEFLQGVAERINNRYGHELKSSLSIARNRMEYVKEKSDCQPKVTTLATQSNHKNPELRPSLPRCVQCSGLHGVWRCRVFRNSPLRDRVKVVQQHRLCRVCLAQGHIARFCGSGFRCRISGCGRDHHYLLDHAQENDVGKSTEARHENVTRGPITPKSTQIHDTRVIPGSTSVQQVNPVNPPAVCSSTAVQSNDTVAVTAVGSSRPRVCFKVVPVKISYPGSTERITTHAFLDSGSDATFCLESLARKLGVEEMKPTNYTMITANSEEQRSGYKVQLSIESLQGDVKFDLNDVLTTSSLPVTLQHMPSYEDLRRWPHLSDVDLPEAKEGEVSILIGADRPDIIEKQLDKREGESGEPVAVRTPLGWTVFGPIGESTTDHIRLNFSRTDQESLNAQMERMYNEEFTEANADAERGLSIEDRRARKIMDQSATLVNGHYQLKLPFRKDPPNLPDSLAVAERRLKWLKAKFQKNPVFQSQYSSVLEKYQEEGSSRQVPDSEVSNLKPIWYLPHHAVWHPRKPEEPRVVFDCASVSNGTSLNEQLLRGPENTSTLIGVILRFRVDDIAVTADIKRMFHQVCVAPEDCGALCYLWWPNGDVSKDPKTYQMLVHIFGAKSSPSIASYALRKTAKDNEQNFSKEAVDAVFRDFYVDDLLKSFAGQEHAIELSKELQELLARGGFKLTKWISNSRSVLSAFPVEERAPHIKNLDLTSECLPMDRALGVHWNVEKDTLDFVVSSKEQLENRKGVLSSIATVFDPLGFASPLLLPDREINQELCRLKFNWDMRLPEEFSTSWRNWREGLVSLEGFSIPGCYRPRGFGELKEAQLHHFADASQEHGYGTASYLRLTNDRDQIHCSFVMGKSRLRPLKNAVTIPKLELTAATLAVRINQVVMRELEGS